MQLFAEVDQVFLEVLKNVSKFVQVFVKTGNRFGFAEHDFVEVAKIGPTLFEGLFHSGFLCFPDKIKIYNYISLN